MRAQWDPHDRCETPTFDLDEGMMLQAWNKAEVIVSARRHCSCSCSCDMGRGRGYDDGEARLGWGASER
jgi:hypothetical protein